ncbi:UPF0481 protein At3g47200-like isoform X2 [Tasmannia lanceolata]|uniref:UPF0481 protein At3g47200-like isoform X2 n=1 Tax=Tasmannia lanceolata TaxID=3420 RepID=UPI004063B94A
MVAFNLLHNLFLDLVKAGMAQQSTMEERRDWVVQLNKRHQSIYGNEDFWNKQSIYRVPPYVRNRNMKAYGPQIVSFGPYHHGKPQLMPMEEHKVRAVHHLLEISDKSTTPTDYANALEAVVEELRESYDHLDSKWKDRNKFLELIFQDGCFLLEVLRKFSDPSYGQYAENDPIFSQYGFYKNSNAIFEDMLKIENQVPLLALNKLVAVEKRMTPEESAKYINDLVVKFLDSRPTPFKVKRMDSGSNTCKHMLELARMCMVGDLDSSSQGEENARLLGLRLRVIHATKLNKNAGVKLQPSENNSLDRKNAGVESQPREYNNLDGFDFVDEKGILNLPLIRIYDCTESLLLNLIAFESLHVGTIHYVSSYVRYIGGLIQSVEDSVFVKEKGIIITDHDHDHIVKLIRKLRYDMGFTPKFTFRHKIKPLNIYYDSRTKKWKKRLRTWYSDFKGKYFDSPWSFCALVAAVVLLALTIAQTVYKVIDFYKSG